MKAVTVLKSPGYGTIKEKALARGKAAEIELILCCARSEIDAPTAALMRKLLQNGIDWEYASAIARRQGVQSLFYNSLRRTSPDLVPNAVLNKLQRAFHIRSARTHLQVEELLELLDAFSGCGITALPFKGPVLSAYVYGNPVLRRSGDLDLLIHMSDFAAARDILIASGYEARVQPGKEEKYLRGRGGSTFTRAKGNVDLHWTLEQKSFDSFPFSYKYDPGQLFQRSTTVPVRGTAVPSLSAEDLLLYLSAHGAKHSWSSLYLICDIAELIRAHGDEIDWRWIREQTQRLRSRRFLGLSLLLAIELLDAGLPGEVSERVRNDTKVESLAMQVCEWLFGPSIEASLEDGPLKYHFFRAKLLPDWREKTLYLFFRGLRKLSKVG